MRNNISAAREIAEARADDYAAALWESVPLLGQAGSPYVTFPDIVSAALVGREAALTPARGDLFRFPRPDFDPVAIAVFTAWFLDYRYFQFSFEQAPVALLFGTDPVDVNADDASRLSVAAAQFLCGYEQEDPDKRAGGAPLAALAIKESMVGGPLPEEWI
jgi:hypothetical protein